MEFYGEKTSVAQKYFKQPERLPGELVHKLNQLWQAQSLVFYLAMTCALFINLNKFGNR